MARRAPQSLEGLNPRRQGSTLRDMAERFQVFLSYDHSDGKWARKLSEYLEAAGFRVFDRQNQLFPGDNWALEIGKALDTSNTMVVLISPAAMRSWSVRQEIDYALGSLKYKDRLIPVLVEATDDYPWIFRHFQWVKGDPAEAGPRIAELLAAKEDLDVHADAH